MTSDAIIVIQCAGSKNENAGNLKAEDGRRIAFVANPAAAPADKDVLYARPDDVADDGKTWRQKLLEYNNNPNGNSDRLLPAYELYQHDCYRRLAEKVGTSRLFILSAGWGLINASFLTPRYDITFSSAAKLPYARRRKNDESFHDFQQLTPIDAQAPILFLGGRSYLALFDHLTGHLENRRIVFYRTPPGGDQNLTEAPEIRNGRAVGFKTNKLTNWHYDCANAFLAGKFDAEISYDGAGGHAL